MFGAGHTRSLTQRTLLQVAVRISVVVTLATFVSYWHVSASLEAQALEQLRQYVEQRRARESSIFELADDNLLAFAETYRQRLAFAAAIDPNPRFETLFESRADGTIRIREAVFAARGLTGFVGKFVEPDDDLKRRLLTAYDLLGDYGPAWRRRFVNLYVVTPENAVVMYWPNQPWALNASDWEISGKLGLVAGSDNDVIVLGAEDAPARQRYWSALYFDYGINDWMVSALEAINENDRHLVSVGHDILLRELIERTITSDLEGTYNLIFAEDGRLVAHPRFMDAIQAQSGALTVQAANDPHLTRIFDLARTRPPEAVIIENPGDDEFLAVTQLAGPDWYLVTVFPKALLASRAFETARLVLLLGAIALLLEIGILYLALKKQVAQPLHELVEATRRLAAGRFDAKLAVDKDDEIGHLARSFNTMADAVDARENALSERTDRLAELNEQLGRELKERERAEREIARQREALHQSEKLNALGSLLAGVAHELNNPLSVVVGRSSMLAEQLGASPQANAVGKIRAAAERCARIVKTFLAMARQQEPSRESVQVADVVNATLEVVGFGLRRDQIEVTVDLPTMLPEVLADPSQLTQVFTNLLVNAQHALAGGAAPRRIWIEGDFEPGGQILEIRVRDNGPGIAPELMPRVFEPFFTTKEQGEGTGLGLSVCRGLVEAHGGTLTVHLPAARGTEFHIRLPVGTTDNATAAPAREPEPPRGHRILVIEDEPEIAEMLVEIVEHLGHRVDVAQTGQAALECLRVGRYDLVLSDLRLPDLNGADLYRRLSVTDREHAARMVFVTGDALSGSAGQFFADVKRPLIEKPFAPAEIARVIAEQLEQAGAAETDAPSSVA